MTEEKRGRDSRFRRTDRLLIALMVLPLAACIALKVLYKPESEGVDISGAMIYLRIALQGNQQLSFAFKPSSV